MKSPLTRTLIPLSLVALITTMATPSLSAEDSYEQEADRVADKFGRPSPMSKSVKERSAQGTRVRTRAGTQVTPSTGQSARAINGDECNPLCGMQEVGAERSQPAQ